VYPPRKVNHYQLPCVTRRYQHGHSVVGRRTLNWGPKQSPNKRKASSLIFPDDIRSSKPTKFVTDIRAVQMAQMPQVPVRQTVDYRGLESYVNIMESRNLSYTNLLAFIQYTTTEDIEVKAAILLEANHDVALITYELITIVTCMVQRRRSNT
jgi:hypothetical protein